MLCPKECVINEGKLYSLIYAKTSSVGFDPIEKKSLYHFLPGSSVLSLGTVGCNFSCSFCQNWQISQANMEDLSLDIISPEKAVNLALQNSSLGIAYTYSEPLIWYEYILDTAKLAKKNKIKNILVTNGFINKEPLVKLLPYVDANSTYCSQCNKVLIKRTGYSVITSGLNDQRNCVYCGEKVARI